MLKSLGKTLGQKIGELLIELIGLLNVRNVTA
jgi:hypothetical protein